MKKLLALLLFCFTALSGTVTVAWDDTLNPPETRYRIYEKSGATYERILETGEKIATLNLATGNHWIIVRAVSTDGIESADSNELKLFVPHAVVIKVVVNP